MHPERSLPRLTHDRAEVRRVAALLLSVLVETGHRDPGRVPVVTSSWRGEDERGWDPEVGRVHAVAHGAGLDAACGRAGLTPWSRRPGSRP